VSGAYRTALTGSFLLSGIVMTGAFLLVLGLPEVTLRTRIDDSEGRVRGADHKGSMFFFEKKNQKTFIHFGATESSALNLAP